MMHGTTNIKVKIIANLLVSPDTFHPEEITSCIRWVVVLVAPRDSWKVWPEEYLLLLTLNRSGPSHIAVTILTELSRLNYGWQIQSNFVLLEVLIKHRTLNA